MTSVNSKENVWILKICCYTPKPTLSFHYLSCLDTTPTNINLTLNLQFFQFSNVIILEMRNGMILCNSILEQWKKIITWNSKTGKSGVTYCRIAALWIVIRTGGVTKLYIDIPTYFTSNILHKKINEKHSIWKPCK